MRFERSGAASAVQGFKENIVECSSELKENAKSGISFKIEAGE